MEERIYWLGFSLFPGIGPKKFHLLLQTFGSAKTAWQADEQELVKSLGQVLVQKFITFRRTCDLEENSIRLAKDNTHFLTLFDTTYPHLLKISSNPPFVLYIKGTFNFNASENRMPVGIVGTRRITSYGRQVTEMITKELVDAGCIIVSGLAMGVDAIAHQTTIDSKGKTVAVLGCGIECCHPSINQRLYDAIITSGGAIVSEFPFTQAPSKGSFPSRNRIIAGLSKGIVVTEGAEDSGALITAKDALQDNRKVFAVPGPITSSLSKGPNNLLSRGASLVTSGQDILQELGMSIPMRRKMSQKIVKGETKEEQKILDILAGEQLSFDEIVKRVELDSATVGTVLSLLEMRGMVTNGESALYRRND